MNHKKEYQLTAENKKLIYSYEVDLDLAERTKGSYIYALTRLASEYLGERSLLSLEPLDMTNWFRGKEWSSSYRGVIWASVKSFAQWASHQDLVDPDRVLPLMKQKFRRAKRTPAGHIPVSKMWEVIEAANTPRARVVCSILFGTGCRRSALAALRWNDFDLHKHRLVLRAEITKGHKRRTVGLMQWLEDELVTYRSSLEEEPKPSDFLFPSPRSEGKHISDHSIYWDFRKSVERVDGIPEGLSHPHIARHTFAVALLESKKVDLFRLQKTLGHSDLSTTAMYLDVADVDREEAVRCAVFRPYKPVEPLSSGDPLEVLRQARLEEGTNPITDYF